VGEFGETSMKKIELKVKPFGSLREP